MLPLRIALCFLLFTIIVQAQSTKATVREYKKVFKTYPYSDPNPIPTMGKIYPYFRYDGYTNKPIDKEWTVVELENEYIKVMILPEIGGKVWAAIEKATGKPYPEDVDERLEDWLAAICAEKQGKIAEMTVALNRIIAFKSQQIAVGNTVTALAYQKLNRPADAEKMLLLSNATPRSPFSRWAEAILRGQAAPTIETNDEQIRVLSEWAKLK